MFGSTFTHNYSNYKKIDLIVKRQTFRNYTCSSHSLSRPVIIAITQVVNDVNMKFHRGEAASRHGIVLLWR